MEREPRDLFYRAATELVSLSLDGKTSLSLAEAIAVLLQTWNVSFYRLRGRFDLEHFAELEQLVGATKSDMADYRRRRLDSLKLAEEEGITEVFQRAEVVLGPVGAAWCRRGLVSKLDELVGFGAPGSPAWKRKAQ